jgi:hypothetical protein
MNGPIAFSKTLRALDADSFRISNLALIATIVLLAGWTWWMVSAGVPQYEISRDVVIQPNRFIASFPARALERVRPGQPATLHLEGESIPAKVIAVGADAATGQVRAILLPATENRVPPASHAEVAIEVERVSPATLILRASGAAARP